MNESMDSSPRNFIKAEMKHKGICIKGMYLLLAGGEEEIIKTSFYNKISRGVLTAVFFSNV